MKAVPAAVSTAFPMLHRAVLVWDSDSPALPPPLLRAFDDDWKGFAARGEQFAEDGWWELETLPVAADASFGSLPVTGNPAVVDRVKGCDLVLARRAGPGEVIKEVLLEAVSAW